MTQGQDSDRVPTPGLLVIDPDEAPRNALATQLSRHLAVKSVPVSVSAHETVAAALADWPGDAPAPWRAVVLAATSDTQARAACARLARQGPRPPRCVVLLPPDQAAPEPWPDGVTRLDRPARLPRLLESVRDALARGDHAPGDQPGGTGERMDAFPLGPFVCDPGQRILTERASGRATALTEKEAAILACLRAARKTVARGALLTRVWGYRGGVTTHTLETHIHRLRRKIEPDPRRPTLLVTDGSGYRLGG